MRIEKSRVIKASKGRVWDVLIDFRNYPVWMKSNEKVEMTSQETVGEGVTYRVTGFLAGKRYRTDNKIIEWKEDKALTVIAISPYGESYSTYEINWHPEGCEVTYSVDIILNKQYKKDPKLESLVYNYFNDLVLEILDKLKYHLETTKRT